MRDALVTGCELPWRNIDLHNESWPEEGVRYKQDVRVSVLGYGIKNFSQCSYNLKIHER